MKTFYALALLIAATVVSAAPAPNPAGKLVAKADAAGRYVFYVVPSAEDEDKY
ncbi:hypothetical protein EMPG_10201 [Blastomyces silverae]|uniref:Uncharacterized protein n=1 Tax=Blastomyces silverae TaxID=2060906 RepID=A0A0H1B5W4_9EURO|nr:hypothetical protein EMPG_10201 [Blastomyces silverae]